jgi:hypothetical protein
MGELVLGGLEEGEGGRGLRCLLRLRRFGTGEIHQCTRWGVWIYPELEDKGRSGIYEVRPEFWKRHRK